MRLLSALLLTLALAAPASAQTVLLADDMEGAIDAKWVVGEPTNPAITPWQKDDSSAPKPRGPQANEGRSYWAGMTPQGLDPAAEVYEGETHLTSKAPIIVPADGKTTISFWSLFQNEGDDAGEFQVALASNTTAKGAWKKVAAVKLVTSEVTNPEYTPGYCTPNPGTHIQGFEEITGDLAAYAGKEIFVRFALKYGSENRQSSFPCGWYVDDLKITTTGTPGKRGDSTPATPATTPPTASKSSVKLGAFKAKGKKATLKLTVAGGDISKAVVTLMKGKKKIATAKAASLRVGARSVTFKLKKKLSRGSYTLKFSGTGADGTGVAATGKAKAR